jgi:hypothetical protein
MSKAPAHKSPYVAASQASYLSLQDHKSVEGEIMDAIGAQERKCYDFFVNHGKLCSIWPFQKPCVILTSWAILSCYWKSDRLKLKHGRLLQAQAGQTPAQLVKEYKETVLNPRYRTFFTLQNSFSCSNWLWNAPISKNEATPILPTAPIPDAKELIGLLNDAMRYEQEIFEDHIRKRQDELAEYQKTHAIDPKARAAFIEACKKYRSEVTVRMQKYGSSDLGIATDKDPQTAFYRMHDKHVSPLDTKRHEYLQAINEPFKQLVR